MGNIKIEVDDSGVIKKLEDMKRNLKNVEKTQSVPVSEIFNPSFISKYTPYSSFDDMLDKSKLLEKYGDFESIDDNEWDIFIQENTNFSNWQEMQSEAGKLWTLKQMGF